MNHLRRTCSVWVGVLLIVPAMIAAARQDQAPASSTTSSPESTSKTPKSNKKKYSHANDFLIRGTVFNEKALSFPGVELRLREQGQKKYRWETYTNSRGEYAVRVPQGSNYEILVHVKGFADQTRTVNAKDGGNEETVVFRMEPITGGKK